MAESRLCNVLQHSITKEPQTHTNTHKHQQTSLRALCEPSSKSANLAETKTAPSALAQWLLTVADSWLCVRMGMCA